MFGSDAGGGFGLRVALLTVTLVTIFALAGVVQNDFVDWDDNSVIVRNEAYQGLSWPHLRWMFTTGFAGHYQPFTWLSYAIESCLWGVRPGVFHLSNLLLHVGTGIVFFFVTRRLLGVAFSRPAAATKTLGALIATLLFAVHPLRVESVAWATERRDVLSGFWLMLTVVCYLRAVEPNVGWGRQVTFVLSFVFYVLSLSSKAAGIPLPIILLLLDVYPLRRFAHSAETRNNNRARRILLEKVPFFAAALVFGLVALWAQRQSGALRSPGEHSVELRIGQAFYGTFFYLWKSIWPAGLIPLYEQDPLASAFDSRNVLAACVFAGLTSVSWHFRRRWPALLVAWSAYIAFLMPVLGLAQSGPQLVADRYSYLSCMPWAVLAGGGMAHLWASGGKRRRTIRPTAVAIAVVVVAILTFLTRSQTRIWADSYTLWTTVIERAPHTGTAHANLASLFNRKGDHEKARDHSLVALDILPGNRTAHIALARASMMLGDLATAERHFEVALQIRPHDPARLGDLAYVESRLGKPEEAETHYRKVIDFEPHSANARFNLASFLASQGREHEATLCLEEAVELDPTMSAAWFRLAVVRWKANEPAAAIGALEMGLARTPDEPLLKAKLAWMLATCRIDELRDGPRAVELARQATGADPGVDLVVREALAAALAEVGDFTEAVITLDEVLTDPASLVSEAARERLRFQRAQYRRGIPSRDPDRWKP